MGTSLGSQTYGMVPLFLEEIWSEQKEAKQVVVCVCVCAWCRRVPPTCWAWSVYYTDMALQGVERDA